MEQLEYQVEELHRGEWQPIISKDKKGKKSNKIVRISSDHAEILNGDSKETRLRYVKVKVEKAPKEEKSKK